MKKVKKVVKLNEATLRKMIKETAKRVLKEGYGVGSSLTDRDFFMNNDRRMYNDSSEGDDISTAYSSQFKEVLNHLNAAMKILDQIDPAEYDDYTEQVDEKLHEIYDSVETAAVDVKSFISGDFVRSLY